MTLPKEFDSTWSFAWHRKGAKQIPHNDMHVIDNINRKYGENFNRMFTQQIYFPETKCYADNECDCEESGIWLSESKKKRVTQIKCIMRFGGYQGVREQLAKEQFKIQMEWHDRLMKRQYEMLPKTFRENLTIGEEDRQEGSHE
jgi:hypothetical protein